MRYIYYKYLYISLIVVVSCGLAQFFNVPRTDRYAYILPCAHTERSKKFTLWLHNRFQYYDRSV